MTPGKTAKIVLGTSLCLFLGLLLVPAKADQLDTLESTLSEKFEKFENTLSNDSLSAETAPNIFPPGLTGLKFYDSLLLKKYTEKNLYLMDHEVSSFKLQYYSSIIIFFMVVIIVGLGLYLSYRQFRLSEILLSRPVATKKQKTEIEPTSSSFNQSTFEVSKDGVKINTAVIGLMILVISLVFFFLYLKYVYKISII